MWDRYLLWYVARDCDRPGWNCAHNLIFLRFDSCGPISICRESWWQKAPDGLPYHIQIQANLLPGAEKEPADVLEKAIESLPFGDPNEAERQMREFRHWLDSEALRREEAFYAGQAQANSMSYASAALEDVQTQLNRLNETV